MGSHRAASRASRFPRAAAATALGFMIMSLLSAAPAFAASGTYVRLAQLTENMAGAELVLSSVSDPQRSVTIPGVPYGGLSEYRLVQPGDYVVGVKAVGGDGTTPSVTQTLNAMAGSAYTLASVGDAGNGSLAVFTDDLTPPEPGNAKVRVIDAAPPGQPIDVRGPAGVFAQGLESGRASGYLTFPAGPTTLTVGPAGGSTVDIPITVNANQVASVVLVNRDGKIAADVRVDAEGPAMMPPGPIKAGFGGAAPGRPDPLTGAFTFGVLAAASAALSAFLSRRGRSVRQQSY